MKKLGLAPCIAEGTIVLIEKDLVMVRHDRIVGEDAFDFTNLHPALITKISR